jgi:hypothetical protein
MKWMETLQGAADSLAASMVYYDNLPSSEYHEIKITDNGTICHIIDWGNYMTKVYTPPAVQFKGGGWGGQ